MAEQDEPIITEKVAGYTMTVRYEEPSPEAKERWERRSEVLAAWLLDQWNREQAAKHDAPKNSD